MKNKNHKKQARQKKIEADKFEEKFTKDFTPLIDTLSLDDEDGSWKLLRNLFIIFCFRYLQQQTSVHVTYHPDENWQALEVAYDLLYGKRSATARDPTAPVVEIIQSWEWMPVYALRNHLYPFLLASPGFILKFLNIDSNFLVVHSMYFIHCLVWTFGDYFYYHLSRSIGGKQFAVVSLMVVLSNEFVIKYICHTSMNGIEGNLTMAALYYYLYLKPEIGNVNLNKMTLLITINFLARSSSLAPWAPLAFIKIYENRDYFVPIVVAGLTITVPCFIVSCLIDSYYYNTFTVPQYNFIGINVLENLSTFFGTEPFYYYIVILGFEFGSIHELSTFGLALITYKQLRGTLYHYNRNMRELGVERSLAPTLFIYCFTVVLVLSAVDHKESRFQTPLTQVGCLCQAYAVVQVVNFVKILYRKKYFLTARIAGTVVKTLLVWAMVWDAKKFVIMMLFFPGQLNSMLEPYHVFNGYTPHLYKDGNMSNSASFRRAESVYFLEKFEQPIHLLLHKPAWDTWGTDDWADGSLKTTGLYQAFRQPLFVNSKMPDLSGLRQPNNPNVKIPPVNAPWMKHDDQLYPLVELFYQIEQEQRFPEYIWGHHGGTVIVERKTEDHLFRMAIKKFQKWYDVLDTFHGKNDMLHPWAKASRNSQVYMLRLKDQFRPGMIRAGYSYDPSGFNKGSMGSLTDLNRAFAGFESQYLQEMEERMQELRERQARQKRKQNDTNRTINS